MYVIHLIWFIKGAIEDLSGRVVDFPIQYPGSGVVLVCLDSCSLPSSLLRIKGPLVSESPETLLCLKQDTLSSAEYWFNTVRQETVPT